MRFNRLAMTSALIIALPGCAPVPSPTPITDLSGTSWRVVAVNGRATPAEGDYALRFDRRGGLGARFGCNSMGGRYRLLGDVLSVSDLASTLMGCPDPAAAFERDGAAVLSLPMRISFTSSDRMGLGNAKGSITLDPVS